MPEGKGINVIRNQLMDDISSEVGKSIGIEQNDMNLDFKSSLDKAISNFSSSSFDDDGYIKKMESLDIKDKDMISNILGGMSNETMNIQSFNHSELTLRRDMFNICTQMPEMRDVIYVVRDAIIECNVATGQVSRTIVFDGRENDSGILDSHEAIVTEMEDKYDLLMSIKNFIIPTTLTVGETYIYVVPYSKLFAELEAINRLKGSRYHGRFMESVFSESVPSSVLESFKPSRTLNDANGENLKLLLESVSSESKIDVVTESKFNEVNGDESQSSTTTFQKTKSNKFAETSKKSIEYILDNINICNGISPLMEEFGIDGFTEIVMDSYKEENTGVKKDESEVFVENIENGSIGGNIPEGELNLSQYENVKGCYIKYLDGLKMIPIRMDRRVIGYFYISTTIDISETPNSANGIVDVSAQRYSRDKNLVDRLASVIISNFDKKMLDKNIKLKSEIAEVIMAHKFADGKLSIIYIPDNEVVRIRVNEDENGKGHSILEPSLFPARMFLMLNLYNMLYTLNNTTTRIHYIRSSGLNKNYAAQIQRTIRKFESRRITIDDIYSYRGAMSKLGGMGEMILPAGRGDYKALETDTIAAVDNPISTEFLEQQRRQAISGTGAPHMLVINAIDEVDFAKTLEMANARFISTTSSYKIDFNRWITLLYRLILKHSTNMEDDIIKTFRFQFNASKQQDLAITSDMIQNYNALVETVRSIYYSNSEWEDGNGMPTSKQREIRKSLALEYLPQINIELLDKMVEKANIAAGATITTDRVKNAVINKGDLNEVQLK